MDTGTIVKPMRYGFVAVYDFNKVVSVIPIENEQVNAIMSALEEVFTSPGTLFQIYSDEEGAMNSNKF